MKDVTIILDKIGKLPWWFWVAAFSLLGLATGNIQILITIGKTSM